MARHRQEVIPVRSKETTCASLHFHSSPLHTLLILLTPSLSHPQAAGSSAGHGGPSQQRAAQPGGWPVPGQAAAARSSAPSTLVPSPLLRPEEAMEEHPALWAPRNRSAGVRGQRLGVASCRVCSYACANFYIRVWLTGIGSTCCDWSVMHVLVWLTGIGGIYLL